MNSAQKIVCRKINVELEIGELVAIVGPTGSGKTTLAHMIPGFYRPTSGKVTFDGQDIAEVNIDSLRSQVSYVFQEHLLMSESIRSNFSLVNPQATEAEMWQACNIAEATSFIDAMPDGLDTVLGRSGDTLSVGQKGRLVVVIAHRLSTIRHADRIIFLEDGEIADIGSHDALMAVPEGRYRRFVELQNVRDGS